jgi:hypothetical protein
MKGSLWTGSLEPSGGNTSTLIAVVLNLIGRLLHSRLARVSGSPPYCEDAGNGLSHSKLCDMPQAATGHAAHNNSRLCPYCHTHSVLTLSAWKTTHPTICQYRKKAEASPTAKQRFSWWRQRDRTDRWT